MLRFLAEDVGKDLDAVLDAILRALARRLQSAARVEPLNSYGEAVNDIAYGLVGARDVALWLDEHGLPECGFSQISGLLATLSIWSSRGSRPIPARWGEFRVFAVFGFQLRLSLPSWLKGKPQRASSRCTPTSRLTTSARRCSLRPKPSANERCPSPPANEVPHRQRAFASGGCSRNRPVVMPQFVDP